MPGTRRRRLLVILPGLVLAPALGWGAYAAVAWLTFGHPRPAGTSDPLMDRHLPHPDIAEVHQTRVAAPPSVTYAVARRMDLQRSGIIHAIFRGRELILGATPDARRPHVPLVDELLSLGWGVLEDVPGRQLVFGAVTQPWRTDVVFRALPRESFASFDSAGYVKIVVTLAVDSVGPSDSVFRTETRALATNPAARAKFRRYWSVFSPGILLIRREAVRLVRREAERSEAKRGPASQPS
ncbi:MAG TPA: hypothetical protein VFQ38_20110 [Longimicrobiales bacterium]|nr:hypothetical protein [Longimicrobiales bacterium]